MSVPHNVLPFSEYFDANRPYNYQVTRQHKQIIAYTVITLYFLLRISKSYYLFFNSNFFYYLKKFSRFFKSFLFIILIFILM
jgi:hypothetical protein